MQTTNQKKKAWSLQDVILLAIIAIFFGIIYQLWGYTYYALAATPLKVYANDATLGVWIMAGPLAAILLKKAGASVIGEVLAATVEMLLFSSWGAANLISGLIQGLASELGFTLTAYKNWGALSLTLATITSTIVTFAWDLFQSGYAAYNFALLVSLFIIRLLSIGFFAGLLVYLIKALLNKSGLVR
ncbi:ECF transporter S component [Ligilactobacillus agilis]|uniref:ECF transporter S component n=1 Tax=Ligilactobacillus agilis TaxID=1601 RepID=UPI0014381099|nr:ECF transporter S component [Ligilactobacillus agilis]GET15001.1 energy-coupling factor transporter substrate-binding protein [Ligilactobacillus agilis]